MKYDIRVVAAILKDDQNRVLIAQRPVGDKHEGLWEFPGGKLEAGESYAVALQRELLEELAIEVKVGREVARTEFRSGTKLLELVAFEVTILRGTPTLLFHQDMRFAAIHDLRNWPLLPADYDFVTALENEKCPSTPQ